MTSEEQLRSLGLPKVALQGRRNLQRISLVSSADARLLVPSFLRRCIVTQQVHPHLMISTSLQALCAFNLLTLNGAMG